MVSSRNSWLTEDLCISMSAIPGLANGTRKAAEPLARAPLPSLFLARRYSAGIGSRSHVDESDSTDAWPPGTIGFPCSGGPG